MGATNIDEAATILQAPRSPRWNVALNAVSRFLEAAARKRGAFPAEAEDIAQDVLLKLSARFESGEVPWAPGRHRGYLNACASNGVVSLRRKDTKHAVQPPDEIAADVPDAPDAPDERGQQALDLLPKVARVARELRAPRYRGDFDEAWSQLQELFHRGTSLRELLVKAGRVAPNADEATWIKARNAAYTAHKRVRAALLRAVKRLLDAGELTPEEAELVRRTLGSFIRCQRTPPASVTPGKGPA